MLPQLNGTTQDGKMDYSAVHPAAIRKVWQTILPGIQKIRQSNGESWLPEDIYAALVQNQATLYVFHEKTGAFAGFGVLEAMTFPFEMQPALNMWLGYFAEKGNGHYGLEVAKLVQQHAGLERVVFSTPQDNPWVDASSSRKITTWYEV